MSGLLYEIERKRIKPNNMQYNLILEMIDYKENDNNNANIKNGTENNANAILSLYNVTKEKKIKTWLININPDIPLSKIKISKFPKNIYSYWKNNEFLKDE